MQTLPTSRRDWGGEEEEEANLSIDATEAFGNSFRISFAASALSLCFVLFFDSLFFSFYLRVLLLFLCSLAFRFCFYIFSRSGQTLRLSAGSKFSQMNGTHNV